MILFLILGIALSIAVYFLGGLIFVDTSKIILMAVSVTVFLIMIGVMTFLINKGVSTLPEGAYYPDRKETNDSNRED